MISLSLHINQSKVWFFAARAVVDYPQEVPPQKVLLGGPFWGGTSWVHQSSANSKSIYFTSLLPSFHFHFTSKPHTFDFIKTKYLPTLLHFFSTSSQANYFSAAPVVAIISLAQHIKQSQPFCSFCCSRVTTSSSHQYQNFFCISCCSWVPIIELDKLKFEIIFPQLVL